MIEFRFSEEDSTVIQLLKTPMSFPRNGHAACWIGKNQILVSGSKGTQSGKETELYDIESDSWKTLGPMHVSRHFHAMTSITGGKYAFVIGGIDNTTREYTGVLERLNLAESKWEKIQLNIEFPPRQGCGII